MGYPTRKEIEEILNSISEDDYSMILPEDASKVDQIKYQLCKRFVCYLLDTKITQSELARILDVDRSRVNWIIKYRIEHFTIDRLYELLNKLDPTLELKIS
jgi:predicted XRE-type DNA-binding protein